MTHSPMTTLLGREDATTQERGVAAIWVAMMLTLLMGFAAMAVDLGMWYVTRSEVQNATDAAALAGAAMLPTDPDLAVAEAIRVAGQHGYQPAEVTAIVQGGGRLHVRIEHDVDNFFLPSFGLEDTTTVGTNALAEYEGTVTMGSPSNVLGNDPEQGGSYDQPDFVLGMAGPGHRKQSGDRYGTKLCNWYNAPAVSNCTGRYGPNLDFDENGYFFSVKVEATHGQDLVISAFDFVHMDAGPGWRCLSSYGSSLDYTERNNVRNLTLSGDYTHAGETIPQGWYDDAHTRYQSDSSRWCVEDGEYSSGYASYGGAAPDTTLIVRQPDATPWNALDNQILGVDVPSPDCEPVTVGGYTYLEGSEDNDSRPSAYQLLNPTDPWWHSSREWVIDHDDDTWTVAETWRRWAPLCVIPAGSVQTGEYIVQIRTSADPGSPTVYDATKDEEGLNNFMLRAGFDDGTGTPNAHGGDVAVSARGRLPIYAGSSDAEPEFWLARVLPVSQSRTLTVELFDAGDASGYGSIQVIPPHESVNVSEFSGCNFLLDANGSHNEHPSTCTITNVSRYSGFQGRTMLIDVPIPADYDCDESDPEGCWIKIKMDWPGRVTDQTTWGAYISGDPVRLIE